MGMMMAGVIVPTMVLRGALRVRIAQHDSKAPLDRSQHETRGNEGAKAEHREHEGRRPMPRTARSPTVACSPHDRSTMPQRPHEYGSRSLTDGTRHQRAPQPRSAAGR